MIIQSTNNGTTTDQMVIRKMRKSTINIPLNPYIIKWAILVPVTGKATKKDENIVYKIGMGFRNQKTNEIYFVAANKDAMSTKLARLKGKLTKEYRVTIITDKQLGLVKSEEGFLSVATDLQKANSFIIK